MRRAGLLRDRIVVYRLKGDGRVNQWGTFDKSTRQRNLEEIARCRARVMQSKGDDAVINDNDIFDKQYTILVRKNDLTYPLYESGKGCQIFLLRILGRVEETENQNNQLFKIASIDLDHLEQVYKIRVVSIDPSITGTLF